MSLINLVYVSRATMEMLDEDLIHLLAQARDRNKAQNVTGMLLYGNGKFIQILEGEHSDVEAIYSSILIDSRNAGNAIAEKCEIQTRSFPNWSMGFKNISGCNRSHIEGYSPFMEAELSQSEVCCDSGDIVAALMTFKEMADGGPIV